MNYITEYINIFHCNLYRLFITFTSMIKPIDNTDGDSDLKIKQKCFLYVFHNDVRFGLQTPTCINRITKSGDKS
jgi:hypothetical protein